MQARARWRISVVFLLTLIMVTVGMVAPGYLPAADAATAYVPADSVQVTLVADGAHDGSGTETYLRSEYGYTPGDDTTTDGVVSSGDVATYRVTINLVAGPQRQLTLKFSHNAPSGSLNIVDFSALSIGGGIITGTWDHDQNAWVYTVPRGATGSVTGVVTIRAKDTFGKVVENNQIKTELQQNNVTKFTSVSDPVTVISAPMADLTIRSSSNASYHGPQNPGTSGSFLIEPRTITPVGFSSHGATAATEWKTDIDVSAFPQGTTWKLRETALTPINGVLKDVTGSGNATLTYTLPEAAAPSADNPAAAYTVSFRCSPGCVFCRGSKERA